MIRYTQNLLKFFLILLFSTTMASSVMAKEIRSMGTPERVAVIAIVKDINKLYNRADLNIVSIVGKDARTAGTIVTLRIDNDKVESFKAEENTIDIEISEPAASTSTDEVHDF